MADSRSSPSSVLVVGSVNVDLVVRAPRLPGAGETVTGGIFEQHGGGKGANQAVAAARAGASVRFVGCVGDDAIGAQALAGLADEGIDVSGVAGIRGVATGIAVIVVDATGENQIAVAPGANARLDAAAVELALAGLTLDAGGVCLLGLEVPDEGVLAAARRASGAGMRIVLNPAPARPLAAVLLGLGPILTPNRGEAEALTGLADPEAAARALAERTGAPVLVTMGGEGLVLLDRGAVTRLQAYQVAAVDATGAGDTFNGVLAAELAGGASLVGAARRATAAAALSVTRKGARGMPTLAEIEALVGAAEAAPLDQS